MIKNFSESMHILTFSDNAKKYMKGQILTEIFYIKLITNKNMQFQILFCCFTCCIVALLFYVHGKHLRSCRDGQLT